MKGSNLIQNISIGVGIAVFCAVTGSQYFANGQKPPIATTSSSESGSQSNATSLGLGAEATTSVSAAFVQATSTKLGAAFSVQMGKSILIPAVDPKNEIKISFVSLDSVLDQKTAMISVVTHAGAQTFARLSLRDDQSMVTKIDSYILRLIDLSDNDGAIATLSFSSSTASSTKE